MRRKLIFVLSFFLLITATNSCLIYDIEADTIYNHSIKKAPFDAIIVPGIPYNGKQWDNVMKMRVLWAAYLYKKAYTKKVIFSGSAVYSHFVESKIMKQYGIALGIKAKDILLETKAKHSSENIYYSYVMAREKGWIKVAVATDLVQIKMIKKFVVTKRMPVSFLPAKINIIKNMTIPDSIPIDTMAAFVPNFKSIMETETWLQRWHGTQGKNIDFRKYY